MSHNHAVVHRYATSTAPIIGGTTLCEMDHAFGRARQVVHPARNKRHGATDSPLRLHGGHSGDNGRQQLLKRQTGP